MGLKVQPCCQSAVDGASSQWVASGLDAAARVGSTEGGHRCPQHHGQCRAPSRTTTNRGLAKDVEQVVIAASEAVLLGAVDAGPGQERRNCSSATWSG